ncbi:uncharacterized protein LOC106171986 [Lingula anatina]|uniref:Uncharacterized protein LOC106171986 n=1 Tax=Lingula anatina TaxID=7574 RepID=A0A1S3JCR7_LINAN|nr:uncharacterized protein LOC106171986 [Lingula anatina]|eukprot:XP_013407976.1 uncharacterized protein LOC106171986 [Lingula anatina]
MSMIDTTSRLAFSKDYRLPKPQYRFEDAGDYRQLMVSARKRNETEAMRKFWKSLKGFNLKGRDLQLDIVPRYETPHFPASPGPRFSSYITTYDLLGPTPAEGRAQSALYRRNIQTPVTNIARDYSQFTRAPSRNRRPHTTFSERDAQSPWFKEIRKDVPERVAYTMDMDPDFGNDRLAALQLPPAVKSREVVYYPAEYSGRKEFHISPEWNSERPQWGGIAREGHYQKRNEGHSQPSTGNLYGAYYGTVGPERYDFAQNAWK